MEVKLTPYEEEIEKELEKGQPIEDLEAWKDALKEAASRTLTEREKAVTLKFPSKEAKEEALRMLRERFGEDLEILS